MKEENSEKKTQISMKLERPYFNIIKILKMIFSYLFIFCLILVQSLNNFTDVFLIKIMNHRKTKIYH